jgi:hypothetical protein
MNREQRAKLKQQVEANKAAKDNPGKMVATVDEVRKVPESDLRPTNDHPEYCTGTIRDDDVQRAVAALVADGEPVKPTKKPKAMLKGRLPDNSQFKLKYNDKKKFWTGTLIVPVGQDHPKVFSGGHSSVFRTLEVLDSLYRKWLMEQSANVEEGVANG